MKKTIKTLACILLACCISVTVACGGSTAKPELNLEKAKDNLEAKGYQVNLASGVSFIVDGMIVYRLNAINGEENSITIYEFCSNDIAKSYYNTQMSMNTYQITMAQTQRDFNKALLADKALTLTDRDRKALEEEIAYFEKTLASTIRLLASAASSSGSVPKTQLKTQKKLNLS